MIVQRTTSVSPSDLCQVWTQEASLGSALLSMLGRLSSARWLVTTLGARGVVAFQRRGDARERIGCGADLDLIMQRLWAEAAAQGKDGAGSTEPGCTALNGSSVRYGGCLEERMCEMVVQHAGRLGSYVHGHIPLGHQLSLPHSVHSTRVVGGCSLSRPLV